MTMLLIIAGSLLLLPWILGLTVIRENESGLVVKRFGRALAPGRLIAVDGEAGYQARMLPPGWHIVWRWRSKVVRVPLVIVPPQQIACIVANDGAATPAERMLGRQVECDDFQDADAFLRRGGERGRQLAVLTAGSYRINPAAFTVITSSNAQQHGLHPRDMQLVHVPADSVGTITVLDGHPIPAGDLAGHIVKGHEGFQRAQTFIDAGGCRGLQEEVLLSGMWTLNPWFVKIELIPLTEIPIGYVGVVVSYVGDEHLDVTGTDFTHGDLVDRGRKGVWVEPLLPGKHPVNTHVMKVELVPTTNIVLNWAPRTESHQYDDRLAPITVRSKDGFSFTLDVSQIIHIAMSNAPRVISRVGSMQNLVDHVLQPVVGNYFRNSAQQVTVLDFLSARSERQRDAFEHIGGALAAYDVECIDTLVGDIQAPPELMKTQTDRKIADELQRTYDAQREAEVKRQALARENAIANMQAEVVRSEQEVRIAQTNAASAIETARGAAEAIRMRGEAEASALRELGNAKAEAYRDGRTALGEDAYTAIQIATVLGEAKMKLVPDIAVGGSESSTRLADVLVGKMLKGAA